MTRSLNFLWVGCPGITVPYDAQETVRSLLATKNCVPVFPELGVLEKHPKFCNGALRNCINSTINWYDDRTAWQAYREVNILYTHTIMGVYKKHCVWIDDHHLFLVPELLSRKTKAIMNIGLFIHPPSPVQRHSAHLHITENTLRTVLLKFDWVPLI